MSKKSKRRKPPVLTTRVGLVQLPDFHEEVPDDDEGVKRFVSLRGHQRCRAIGLHRGDCSQPKLPGKAYCYYHDKLFEGLMMPSEENQSVPGPVGIDAYPVWPLPANGYILATPARVA